MSRTKKQIDYILSGRNIQALSEFKYISKPIDLGCNVCKHEWTTTMFKIINQHTGCPKCAGNVQSTTSEFITKANKVHNYTYNYASTNYISAKIPVDVQCRVHGIFKVIPNRHLSGRQGCPSCATNTLLTNEQFDYKLQEANRGIIRIGNYTGSHHLIEVKCTTCSYQWKAKPTKLQGKTATGCPKCRTKKGLFGTHTIMNGIQFRSILESKCYEVVKSHCENNQLTFEHQKRYPQSTTNHTCDFYIPDVQLWIEASGIQTKVYKTRLQKKITWVEELGENFLFVRTPEQLRKILNGNI